MNIQRVKKAVLVMTLLSLVPMTCWARGNNGQGGRRQGPPPEAIEACKGKQAGDSVEFTGRRGETLKAICEDRDGQFVAVPENMPRGGGPRQ